MSKQPKPETIGESGAWVPWPLTQSVWRLDLRPPSRWKVFLVILFTWCRYGRKEAWLTVQKIAKDSNLSERTVKASLKDLFALGVVKRVGRAGKFVVMLDDMSKGHSMGLPQPESEGEDKLARSTGNLTCPSSNSIYSSSVKYRTGLTKKQSYAIKTTLAATSELLGNDAGNLPIPAERAQDLGLLCNTSYHEALVRLENDCDAKTAHKLTAAVLALDSDERVQGRELSFNN